MKDFNPVASIRYRLGRLRSLPDYWRNSNSILFVYTLGKVGSSSLFSTLRERFPFHKVLKAHFVSARNLETMRRNIPNDPSRERAVRLGEEVNAYLAAHAQKRLKIITLVRDPVARQVSDLFQNWSKRFGDRRPDDVPLEEILDYLKENPFDFPERWIRQEFFWFTGVDLFAHPFDRDRGYAIIRAPKADILVIKLERLAGCYRDALREFLHLDVEALVNDNITSESDKSEVSQAVKRRFRLDRARLEALYATPYMEHFYTPAERGAFLAKWSKEAPAADPKQPAIP